MITKHTPAPWCIQVISTKNHNTVVIDRPVVNHTIFRMVIEADNCNKTFQADELDANLALISAAPDLLDALTDLFNDVMYLGFADECNDSFQKASRAIDKAIGK